jgi:Ribbon-helix-helix protein, copG family
MGSPADARVVVKYGGGLPALPFSAQVFCGSAHQIGGYYHASRTISLKLPADLLADLEREAKARRVSKSILIRESLETALRHRSRGAVCCYDLARDLAGTVKGLPLDVASNPKYMEGFGE